MKRILLTLLVVTFVGCGRQEIKNPEDIIATDAKAVLYAPSLEAVFKFLPEELLKYSNVAYAFSESNKPVALVVTSLDPLQAYLAVPSKKDLEDQLQKEIRTQLFLESEYWSGYVFVALKGAIPASFGNKSFLPVTQDIALYAKVKSTELIAGNEDKLESYKKYKSIRGLRSLISSDKILTRFLTHTFVSFSKQVESYELICDSEGVTANIQLLDGSEQARNFNSMQDFTLPKLENVSSDIAFSSSLDFSKLSFPLEGLEIAFKSYLSSINKGDVIFPMDSVFDKLRAAKQVATLGSFSIEQNNIVGQTLIESDDQKMLNETVLKFTDLMSPEFFSKLEEKEGVYTTKILRTLLLPGRVFNTDFNLTVHPEMVSISNKPINEKKLQRSDEIGLFKIILEPKLFTSFDFGEMKLNMKVSVEKNLIKLKAGLK